MTNTLEEGVVGDRVDKPRCGGRHFTGGGRVSRGCGEVDSDRKD